MKLKSIPLSLAVALLLTTIGGNAASAHERDATAYIPDILYAVEGVAPPTVTVVPQQTITVYQTVPQNIVVYRETRILPPSRVVYIRAQPDIWRKPHYIHDNGPPHWGSIRH